MGKLVLLKANVGYDGPPPSINALSPELAEYLFVLHQKVFGSSQADAQDDTTEIDTETLSVNHSLATNLSADDHPQYLTSARHAEIAGNPHGTSAADVGSSDPLWNASRLQSNDVAADAPADGQVLTWDDAQGRWEPRSPQTIGSYVALQLAAYSITPAAGPSAGLLLLPSQSLILGVFVENETDIFGSTGYQIGTQYRRDAWGQCGPENGARNGIDSFQINGPIYTGVNPEGLYFTCLSGTFPGTASIAVRVYYWVQPPW